MSFPEDNLERELSLVNFSYYLQANPEKASKLAKDYYAKFLKQQDKIRDLERNCQDLKQTCRELESEKGDIYADYELVRLALEEEQRKNTDPRSDLHPTLPSFLPSNPHNYF